MLGGVLCILSQRFLVHRGVLGCTKSPLCVPFVSLCCVRFKTEGPALVPVASTVLKSIMLVGLAALAACQLMHSLPWSPLLCDTDILVSNVARKLHTVGLFSIHESPVFVTN